MDEFDGIADDVDNASDCASLFVALYLVILAFFILLNTISKTDAGRSEKAIESVKQTFSAPEASEDIFDERPDVENTYFDGSEQLLSRLQALFASELDITEPEIFNNGAMMRIALPVSSLFKPDEYTILDEKEMFFRELAYLMLEPNDEVKLETEFIMGSSSYLGEYDHEAAQLEIHRAGEVARRFVSLHVDSRHIFIGIQPKNSGTAFFIFYLRPVEDYVVPMME